MKTTVHYSTREPNQREGWELRVPAYPPHPPWSQDVRASVPKGGRFGSRTAGSIVTDANPSEQMYRCSEQMRARVSKADHE